ncbi:kekkon 4 [Carabus blaptoides fortunei]
MSSIFILDLAYNLITVLEAGTFDSNTNLTELYLNNNKITMLSDGLFNKLTNLTKIHLHKNQLTYIGPTVFPESPRLREIFLQRNQLKYFDASVLKLDGLTTIHLYENIWVCDCQLKALFEFSKNKLLNGATKCNMPSELSGKHWIYMTAEDFKCSPETGNVCMHVRERTIYSYNNNMSYKFCQEENETVIGDFITTGGHRYTLQFDTGKDNSPSHLTLEYTKENQSESHCMNSLWTAIVAVTFVLLLTEIFIFIKLKHPTTNYSNEITHGTEENTHIYAKPGISVYHPNKMVQKMVADNGHIYAEPDDSTKFPNGTEQKIMEDNGHIYAEPDYAAASRYKHGSK